ncbi:MAG: undecaprenyl/decaprenyl-phosphate alpha-N-acetylglucosaminyl 1-phosphate transferase, partial [Planctomycetes bacterium]|nr:undecaprenyl/decaprenyl-phosphate alpha-N-acetylglucosaminyl 1-phosphate transferase [Planctomycetota bacterium]
PIPYLGGVAIYLAWAGGILFGIAWIARLDVWGTTGALLFSDPVILGILIGGTAIMALGLFDDLRMASPILKLSGNIIVALLLVFVGLGDDFVGSVLARVGMDFAGEDAWLNWVYTVPLTIFIVVGACNATNLLDGLDGLCGGVLGIISLGFLVLAVHMHMYGAWQQEHVARVLVTLSMLGGALGFLPYNRNPATIFMGDAGSMLLGFNAAVLILMFAEDQNLQWMLGAIVVFGLPIADMVLTLLRRWRAQRPLMMGDRSHFYDQLRDRGLGVKKVVLISYLLAGFFAAAGCIVPIIFRTRFVVPIYGLIGVLVLVAVKKFRMLRVDSPATKPSE